jgi:carboxylate-amine ligase
VIAAIPASRRRRSGHALPFAASAPLSIGTEIEVALIHLTDGQPAGASPEVLGLLAMDGIECPIKAEITQAMLEITSDVHHDAAELGAELRHTAGTLQAHVARLGLGITGGGAHPFSDWSEQVIFPTPRFRRLADTYGYLAKQFAVLSQHVHIGCTDGDEALYLVHALARYVPHLVALTAASPLWRGIDTGFDCSRLNVVRAFPLSGHAPPVLRWRIYSRHIANLYETGVIRSLKDLYWDIRPKPEYGTVEIRVCDSPLSIEMAADVVALLQTLARQLLREQQEPDLEPLYVFYDVNRFRAARYGLGAIWIDPSNGTRQPIADAITQMLEGLAEDAAALGSEAALARLGQRVAVRDNDATRVRHEVRRHREPGAVMRALAARWLAPAPAEDGGR